MEECKGKQKSIVEKEVIINVQEEQIEKLNDECNNNNKKIESLEKENNTLKGKLENCNPTEGKKEENISKMKELAVKNKELEAVSRKRDKELNQLKEELLKYNEKTQNLNEEAEYQKDIDKILIKKVRDIEKLNETLELTLAKKEDDREEAVIVNKTTKLGKEQDLIQSRNTINRLTAEAETEVQRICGQTRRSDCTAGQMDGEAGWWTTCGNIGLPPLARVMGVGRYQQQQQVQRRIENKQGKVNKVCTKYAYGQECKYGETCKFIHKRICKIYVKYGRCRFGQRCNYSHDLEGRCKREEVLIAIKDVLKGIMVEESNSKRKEESIWLSLTNNKTKIRMRHSIQSTRK